MYSLDHYDLGTPRSNSTQQVSVEIDGHSIMVPAGTSIMRAAASVGEQIPKLCATDTLRAFGSCRLCLVEIEGRKGYPASCTTQVAEGMKIRTQSERLSGLRGGVMGHRTACTCLRVGFPGLHGCQLCGNPQKENGQFCTGTRIVVAISPLHSATRILP